MTRLDLHAQPQGTPSLLPHFLCFPIGNSDNDRSMPVHISVAFVSEEYIKSLLSSISTKSFISVLTEYTSIAATKLKPRKIGVSYFAEKNLDQTLEKIGQPHSLKRAATRESTVQTKDIPKALRRPWVIPALAMGFAIFVELATAPHQGRSNQLDEVHNVLSCLAGRCCATRLEYIHSPGHGYLSTLLPRAWLR